MDMKKIQNKMLGIMKNIDSHSRKLMGTFQKSISTRHQGKHAG